MSNQIETADGWQELSEDDKHSTVAFFKGGAECVTSIGESERGDEVLIWQGVPELVEDGTGTPHEVTVFEGYDEVPDGAEYVVTTLKNNQEEPVNSQFAEDLTEARRIAGEETARVSNGEI